MTAPNRETAMYKHILIPTDGSPLSARAVAAGVELAKVLGARVTGLFVAPPPTPLVFEALPAGRATWRRTTTPR